MNKVTVDARGLACPLPVVNAKRAADEMKNGGVLEVLVDNEIAVQNLQKFAGQKGYAVSGEKTAEKEYRVLIQVNGGSVAVPDARKSGMVIVLSANVMGTGDETLGTSLMKAFIFAVTKQDMLPETILCYNTGAYLTCEDSDSLEDLKALEAEGVKVLTCGTCLDFYGLKEKLAVGSVTNMYEIVEIMENADSVIRP
ncbi:MAG: sulfurtransferase-like selenium metabolism protein YedF [Bacillota bacterium]|nr:sulfurtransferase-like selenium metabolism protein YedF [Bacillota bacterium]